MDSDSSDNFIPNEGEGEEEMGPCGPVRLTTFTEPWERGERREGGKEGRIISMETMGFASLNSKELHVIVIMCTCTHNTIRCLQLPCLYN